MADTVIIKNKKKNKKKKSSRKVAYETHIFLF